MIRRDPVRRSGKTKTHIRVVEGYRPGPGLPPKQRTVKSFGYLEDQDDPIAFMRIVEEFDENHKAENALPKMQPSSTERMYSKENRRYNYGYKFLEAIYKQLEIDSFIEESGKLSKFRGKYSPGDIFKFLVFARILCPDSKRASFQLKNSFYGMQTDFTLPDVYRSLDQISGLEIELQRHLNTRVKETIGRDLSHAFYDVTNYFFEIDFPDGDEDLRKKGVSKEHRTDPIIAMGLFMDANGLPVNMSIFPGNTSDSITLQPTMRDIKESYELGRLVVVADKGLNSSKNIDVIVNNGDGYVFSQILRGKKGKRYNEQLFDENGWTCNIDNTYKYKLFTEQYQGATTDGKKETRERKVLLYWSKNESDKAIRKREEKLEKAERSVKNNAYGIKKGVDEYTKENLFDKKTGELLEDTKKIRSVDMEKAIKDAMYDGYFCIITSEMDYDERKIRQVYSGLWKIEQSFRILKSDLYARPVFVSKNEHIRAHFLICFVSLLLIRILQHYTGENSLSAERIARALNSATCKILKGGIINLDDVGGVTAFKKVLNKKGELVDSLAFSDEDEIATDYKQIQEIFGVGCYNMYLKQEIFNKFLKNISLWHNK